jgi:hypothetical protein
MRLREQIRQILPAPLGDLLPLLVAERVLAVSPVPPVLPEFPAGIRVRNPTA